MTELILTEKFSVAADFAKALKIPKRSEGCFRNNDIIITWAVGHLVELWEPEDYDPALKKWRPDTLPLLPETFRYKPIKKTFKQFKIIKKFLQGTDISRVIIATDAGREGEVIARTILLECGFTDKQRIFRFWTSQALVPDVVRKEMKSLKPITEYDRLWRAGYYRQVADWLVGMNCTRMMTLRLHGELFSIGRVQTAVLALIAERKKIRETFVPETYWILKIIFSGDRGKWTGTWFSGKITQFKKKEEIDHLCNSLNRETLPGVVDSVKKETKTEPPPLLFSLTDLQQEANRRFGFPAKKTLGIAQNLYQTKKCLSYPRTDARVLGTQNMEMVNKIIGLLQKAYPAIFDTIEPGRISLSNKRVFNDAKLTDHHALIPFKPLPPGSTRDEQKIFDLVMRRFAAVFHPDCRFENTHVITVFGRETFQTRGRVILVPGWRTVLKDSSGAQAPLEKIPPLVKGDTGIAEKIIPEEKQTSPPPDYTDSLILKDMTNPGRYVEEKEIKKLYRGEIGIGTQATRAQIIETLIARDYVLRKDKKLIATQKGSFLIEMLRKCPVSSVLTLPEETARWEMNLNAIALGTTTHSQFLDGIKNFVRNAVKELKLTTFESMHFKKDIAAATVIGACPACSKPVRENRKAYSCSDPNCKFAVWKKIAGKLISPATASNLLKFKKTGPLKGFLSKKKKRFSATLVLEIVDNQWTVAFDFGNSRNQSQSTHSSEKPAAYPSPKPVCPVCGGPIIKGKKGYGCANWPPEKGDCRFVIWQEICGKKLTLKNIETLALGKKTRSYVFKSQSGDKFKATLKMLKERDRHFAIELLPEKDYNAFPSIRIPCYR